MRQIKIGRNEAGQRLDKFLHKLLADAPRSFLYRMLRKKNITLNGKKASGSEMLAEEDVVTLFLSDDTMDKFSRKEFHRIDSHPEILFENRDVLVVNKPAGVLSQRQDHAIDSLVEQIISYLLDSGSITQEELRTFRPGICNRLDRNTSGIVIAGKTLPALQTLSACIRERRVQKEYLCLVQGVIRGRHRIKGYLHKNENTNRVTVSDRPVRGALPIETEYRSCGDNGRYSLCRVLLITGRTHQIRSHLAAIGHPIIGDAKYGNRGENERFHRKYGLGRQLLHAWEIRFPDSMPDDLGIAGRTFRAPVPRDFQEILSGENLEESINEAEKGEKG